MDRTHALSISRQAKLLGISRANVYYKPVNASAEDLRRMRRIDELHLELPFAGARMLRDLLVLEGTLIGRKAVGTLMRIMGIEAIFRRKNTSKPHPDHKVLRYLLRKLVIDRANQVWAADISYIPMARGFVYPGGDHRLVQPKGARLATLQQHGSRLLRGGLGGSLGEVRRS